MTLSTRANMLSLDNACQTALLRHAPIRLNLASSSSGSEMSGVGFQQGDREPRSQFRLAQHVIGGSRKMAAYAPGLLDPCSPSFRL